MSGHAKQIIPLTKSNSAGFYVDQQTGTATETTRGTINFGKKGTHIVPSAPK